MEAACLSVEHISRSYGSQMAIDDLTFEINQGDMVGFLGPNGAGKSTTMRIVSCFMMPDQGNVYKHGHSIFEQPVAYKRQVGYLPENNPLYPEMYVMDYLEFVASLYGLRGAVRRRRVREVAGYCGLDPEKHKQIGELSKGYRQRVGIAQALVHDPEILILDEPTSGLDPNQTIEIRDFIKDVGRNKAVILSSHILSEIEASCSRALIIHKGRILADDRLEDLKQMMNRKVQLEVVIEADAGSDAIAACLKALAPVTECGHVPGKEKSFWIHVEDGSTGRKAVYDMCVNNHWYLLEMQAKENSLEEVFRSLTK